MPPKKRKEVTEDPEAQSAKTTSAASNKKAKTSETSFDLIDSNAVFSLNIERCNS